MLDGASVAARTKDVFTARRIAECPLYEAQGVMAVAPALQSFLMWGTLKPTPESLGFWLVGQLYNYAADFAQGNDDECERIQGNIEMTLRQVAAAGEPN